MKLWMPGSCCNDPKISHLFDFDSILFPHRFFHNLNHRVVSSHRFHKLCHFYRLFAWLAVITRYIGSRVVVLLGLLIEELEYTEPNRACCPEAKLGGETLTNEFRDFPTWPNHQESTPPGIASIWFHLHHPIRHWHNPPYNKVASKATSSWEVRFWCSYEDNLESDFEWKPRNLMALWSSVSHSLLLWIALDPFNIWNEHRFPLLSSI